MGHMRWTSADSGLVSSRLQRHDLSSGLFAAHVHELFHDLHKRDVELRGHWSVCMLPLRIFSFVLD